MEWLGAHGIDPGVWKARGVSVYTVDDAERVKDSFRGFLKKIKTGPNKGSDNIGPVTRAVQFVDERGVSGGLLMPKHPPPGFLPIPPQLRPHSEVMMDSRTVWHYHGPASRDEWPTFPEEAGNAAGKPLPKMRVLGDRALELHVAKARSQEPYDPLTGEGDHYKIDFKGVHPHAPRQAKYVLFGGNCKRIDVHPWAMTLLPKSQRVFFVLEGTLKNDAVLSAGEAVFSVPSVTLWDPRELSEYARRYLQNKTVFIVPDSDWFTNTLVDTQALLVRSCLRRLRIDAHVAAPPYTAPPKGKTKPELNGVDDFLGKGGGSIDGLIVRGREAPQAPIITWARNVRGRVDRVNRARWALDGVSIHARNGRIDRPPLGTIARFMGVTGPRFSVHLL